jgi:hypothetical protein
MPAQRLHRFRAGDALSARALNLMLAEVERLGRITAVPPVAILQDDVSGIAVGPDFADSQIFVKLTGSAGGAYAWTQESRGGGAWGDTTRTGTTSADPAIEANGNGAVPIGTVVPAWRDTLSGELIFQLAACAP